MKKVLAIVLSVLMIIGIMPITSFALPTMVRSISAVMTQNLIEGVDCGTYGTVWEDENGNIFQEEFAYYPWYEYLECTIEYNLGKTFTGDYWEAIEKFGYELCSYDNQSADNVWGAGTHTGTLELYGESCDVEVTIVESPIESIYAVVTKDLVENFDGYYDYDYIGDGGEATDEYYRYDWEYFTEYTVTYDNGKILTGDSYDLYEMFEYWPLISDDQGFENQWGIGTHKGTVNFMGKECEVEISVVESPVESVSAVMTKDLIENADGNYDFEYIEETDEVTDEYFRYDWAYYLEYTVTYDGGKVFVGNEDDVYDMFGHWPETTDEQSFENQWGVGANKGTVNFMGKECEVDVNIIETPVKSISAVAEVYENVDGWINEEDSYKNYFEYFWTEHAIYTVEFKDGSIFVGDDVALYEEYGYWPWWVSDDQSYKNQWELGTHSGEFEFMGLIGTAEINVVESPFESISATMTRDLFETIDGYSYENWDGDSCCYYEWSNYIEITVTYDGGKEFTGSVQEVEEEFGRYVYVYDEQYDMDTWGVGKNIGHVEFANLECEVEINIVESDGMISGDINGDGNVTAVDARLVLQNTAGISEFTVEQVAVADVNKDGAVTAVDARWILQAVAGLEVL